MPLAIGRPARQALRHWLPWALVGAVLLIPLGLALTAVSEPKADLTICNGDEPQTLDPALITGQLDGRIALALFEGLTSRAPDGHITPGMAESWTISPDQLVYTFKLRPNARWSNGAPLTAGDFLRSWQRVLDPATGSLYSYQLYYYVTKAEDYAMGRLKDFSQVGVKAPDDQTLVVTLSHPTPYFLELTSFQTLCPVYLPAIARFGDNWLKPGNLVSNGPYVLKTWRLRDSIVLEANPYYWQPVPIHRIRVLPTDNPATAFNLFYSKKTDLLLDRSSVPPVLVQEIRKTPFYHPNPFGATCFIRFNVNSPAFQDKRVRRAFALALDKKDYVTKITRCGEAVAPTLVPPGNVGYQSPAGLGYEPDEARRLLAEAGYPGGRNFPDVTLLYAARPNTALGATELQALWQQELGINSIHLRGQEWKTYLSTQSAVDFDLCLSSWVGDYSDPQTFLDLFQSQSENNNTHWKDATYDQLLATSGQTIDPAKRMAILQTMEKRLTEDELPIVPIYYFVGAVLYHNDQLGGFMPNFVDDHRWGDFFIQPHARTGRTDL